MNLATLTPPWLEVDLGEEMNVLSWAINRPGFVKADRILWREVRNADLPRELDVDVWLHKELNEKSALNAVVFLTSRSLQHFTQSTARVGDVIADAVATVGFSNAERVGRRVDRTGDAWGTINVALRLNRGLTESALLEVLSILVQARTAAVMDVDHRIETGIATGTGTDCAAVAAPEGLARYAGLHTDIGEAAGRAVYDAVHQGAKDWVNTMREINNAAT